MLLEAKGACDGGGGGGSYSYEPSPSEQTGGGEPIQAHHKKKGMRVSCKPRILSPFHPSALYKDPRLPSHSTPALSTCTLLACTGPVTDRQTDTPLSPVSPMGDGWVCVGTSMAGKGMRTRLPASLCQSLRTLSPICMRELTSKMAGVAPRSTVSTTGSAIRGLDVVRATSRSNL